MRPRGEIRQALSAAAQSVVQEQAAHQVAPTELGATWLDLAHRACVGRQAAKRTVSNMVTAGELRPAGTVKVPGSRRPVRRYVPAANEGSWDACACLAQVINGWHV
jgi:hypothetical protein